MITVDYISLTLQTDGQLKVAIRCVASR